MKNLFLLLAISLSCLLSNGQTYSPNNFTVSNKAYGIAQAAPTDARSYYYDANLFIQRPYQSTAEVLSYLNLTKYRVGQFPIYVSSGTLQSGGTFAGGTITEYWFKDGTTNSNLVVKQKAPNVTTVVGLRSLSVQPDIVYQSTDNGGGNWQDIGVSDGLYTDNGATYIITANNRVLKRIFSGNINAVWFGVKGDGVTNDAPALQAAINSLPAGVNETDISGLTSSPKAGGVIFLPKGAYKLSSPISIGHEVQLKGENESSTIIYSYVNNDALIKNSTGAVYSTGGFTISDIQIDGRNSVNGTGILVERADQLTIDRVRVTNFPNNGIELNKVQLGSITRVNVEGCGNWGIKLGLADNYPSNNNFFDQVYITLNRKGLLSSGSSNVIIRSTFQANTDSNLVIGLFVTGLEPTMGTVVEGCHFEYNANCYDIDINAGVLKTTLIGNQFYPSGQKTKRFIRNSGDNTLVLNSGNQTDALLINGSRSLIEQNTNSGDIEVRGGMFGVYTDVDSIVAGVPFNISSLAFRSKVTTLYSNDQNTNTSFANTAHIKGVTAGYSQIYSGEFYPRHTFSSYNGANANASILLGSGTSAPDGGFQYFGNKISGVLNDNSFAVDGAYTGTSAPPVSTLNLGYHYFWVDSAGNLRRKPFAKPTYGTDGILVSNTSGFASFTNNNSFSGTNTFGNTVSVNKDFVVQNSTNLPTAYFNTTGSGDIISAGKGGVQTFGARNNGEGYFAGSVSIGEATQPYHAVTKSQLDAKAAASNVDALNADATDLATAITLINELKNVVNNLQSKLRSALLMLPLP